MTKHTTTNLATSLLFTSIFHSGTDTMVSFKCIANSVVVAIACASSVFAEHQVSVTLSHYFSSDVLMRHVPKLTIINGCKDQMVTPTLSLFSGYYTGSNSFSLAPGAANTFNLTDDGPFIGIIYDAADGTTDSGSNTRA